MDEPYDIFNDKVKSNIIALISSGLVKRKLNKAELRIVWMFINIYLRRMFTVLSDEDRDFFIEVQYNEGMDPPKKSTYFTAYRVMRVGTLMRVFESASMLWADTFSYRSMKDLFSDSVTMLDFGMYGSLFGGYIVESLNNTINGLLTLAKSHENLGYKSFLDRFDSEDNEFELSTVAHNIGS